MDAESEHQLHDRLHPARVVVVPGRLGAVQALLQVARPAGAPGDREAGRCLVREDQREVEERSQRQQAARGALEDHQRHQRRSGDHAHPQNRGGRAVGARQEARQQRGNAERRGHRRREHSDPHRTAQRGASVPLPAALDLGVANVGFTIAVLTGPHVVRVLADGHRHAGRLRDNMAAVADEASDGRVTILFRRFRFRPGSGGCERDPEKQQLGEPGEEGSGRSLPLG